MASSGGAVRLRGRFSPGAVVKLVKVRDERVLRAEGGEEVASGTVGADGLLEFTDGVDVGGYYLLVGQVDGTHLEIRARGKADADGDAQLAQAPVAPQPVVLASGGVVSPERELDHPHERHPAPAQHQIPEDVPQMSSTPLGVATPVDLPRPLVVGRQDEAPDELVQRSNTPFGVTTPIPGQQTIKVPGEPEQLVDPQADAPDGLEQRSNTPRGVTAPVAGDPPVKKAPAKRKRKPAAKKKASAASRVKGALSGRGRADTSKEKK